MSSESQQSQQSQQKKVNNWAKAMSEHMKGGGGFPKKGSADYDAVMKIKERLVGSLPVGSQSLPVGSQTRGTKGTTKTPKARHSELSNELERLGNEISNLKKKYSEPAGEPSPHDRIPDAVEMLTKVAPKVRKSKLAKVAGDVGHSVDIVTEKGHPVLSIAHTVPLGRIASTIQNAKLPFQ